MRHRHTCIVALAVGLVLVALPVGSAGGENVSIAVSAASVPFGLNIAAPPTLVAVPGLPVYEAPAVPDNYFVYQGYYYLYHGDTWYYSPDHNGPWVSLVIHQVPRPILAVPVSHFKKPPPHEPKRGTGGHEAMNTPRPHGEKKGHGGRDDKQGPGRNEEKGGGDQ